MEFKTVVNNVKRLIETDKNINNFLEMLHVRVHDDKYITVLVAKKILMASIRVSLDTNEMKSVFRELQAAGAGRYIHGNISSARFVWEFKCIDLIEAVFSDENQDFYFSDEEEEEDYIRSYFDVDDSYNERLINHSIILRKKMIAFIQLPVLLKYDEKERLSSFISSLALGDTADDDEIIKHSYTLRRDLNISLQVPINFTETECYRLQKFVEAYTDSDF